MNQKNLIHEFGEIVCDLKEYLNYQRDLGLEWFPATTKEEDYISTHDISDMHHSQNKIYEDNPITLDLIKDQLRNCKRCKLHVGRKNIVFGSGNKYANLVFIGEAPGGDEDIKGEPFVGNAGQLLTRIINAIDMDRKDVYITNIIKCRPPGNRNPEPDEIKACEPFLRKQIQAINPDIICALGTFAAQTLLQTKQKISTLRGKFYDYHGIKLIPTYHPAFLLRNQNFKRFVWEDMQMVQKEYLSFTLE